MSRPKPVSAYATDALYLAEQYGDAERLNIRREAHRLYTESDVPWLDWMLARIAPRPGDVIADIGCGPGTYHAALAQRGAIIVGVDTSLGMLLDARRETLQAVQPARLIQATAEQLPLADGCADCVVANHMLYHVPDQVAALREMARILKPGGRAIITTNRADASQRLHDLHDAAAEELGYTPLENMGLAFDGSHSERVAAIFPDVTTHEYVDAFVFPDAASALRYYASGIVDAIAERPADGSHRGPLLDAVARRMEAIVAEEGVLRVPKGATSFVAVKAGPA
ncbi:MAG: methyltransferase domain-containing protein [Caldilineaceae bacterium]|nr:methyltransferase domain-containing protein [Caldilineaceae bacterium]